jgi:hypothetical protein
MRGKGERAGEKEEKGERHRDSKSGRDTGR